MKKDIYNLHKNTDVIFDSKVSFWNKVLETLQRVFDLDSISFFEYDESNSMLNLKLHLAQYVVAERQETVYISEDSFVHEVIRDKKSHMLKICENYLLFLPFLPTSFKEIAGSSEGGREGLSAPFQNKTGKDGQIKGIIRLKRCLKKRKFSESEIRAAMDLIKYFEVNHYRVEFLELNRRYSKNIEAITKLTEIFVSSLRVQDSFRLILSGIQHYFGFDRVRLYLVNSQSQKLTGELSVDIRGHVKNISYEEIPLEPNSHRFADLVLGKQSSTFMDRYKDSVIYIPLTIKGVATGLLIADNFLSQRVIDEMDSELLKSFVGQIALAVDNVKLFDKVEELSLYDELTRLPLRRYFMERFQEEIYRAERFKQNLALIWIDLDYFKEINDTYGHQIGDKVLKEVSRIILTSLRKIDFPCRYGGDEILILLPQASGEDAKKFAERLFKEVADIRIPVPFSKEQEIGITISIGIATFHDDASSMEDLLKKADDAMYWAKSHGRNRIALYSEIRDSSFKDL